LPGTTETNRKSMLEPAKGGETTRRSQATIPSAIGKNAVIAPRSCAPVERGYMALAQYTSGL